MDINTWRLKSLYVSLNDAATRIIGFERPFLSKVMVCMPASTVKAVKDTAVPNKTIHEL